MDKKHSKKPRNRRLQNNKIHFKTLDRTADYYEDVKNSSMKDYAFSFKFIEKKI